MNEEEEQYKQAIVRYKPAGKEICNCGVAYTVDGRCEAGCSTALLRAKYRLVACLQRDAGDARLQVGG